NAVLRGQEHPFEVHGEDLVPELLGRVDDGAVALDPGRVDEYVDAAVALGRESHEPLDLDGGGHVRAAAVDLEPVAAELRERFLDRGVVVPAEDDRRASLREPSRGRPPDPERATRDDRHLAVELSHPRPPPPRGRRRAARPGRARAPCRSRRPRRARSSDSWRTARGRCSSAARTTGSRPYGRTPARTRGTASRPRPTRHEGRARRRRPRTTPAPGNRSGRRSRSPYLPAGGP